MTLTRRFIDAAAALRRRALRASRSGWGMGWDSPNPPYAPGEPPPGRRRAVKGGASRRASERPSRGRPLTARRRAGPLRATHKAAMAFGTLDSFAFLRQATAGPSQAMPESPNQNNHISPAGWRRFYLALLIGPSKSTISHAFLRHRTPPLCLYFGQTPSVSRFGAHSHGGVHALLRVRHKAVACSRSGHQQGGPSTHSALVPKDGSRQDGGLSPVSRPRQGTRPARAGT
jgi:hypothetical protein